MRKPIIAGNWKMNNTIKEGLTLVDEIKKVSLSNDVEAVLCVPYTLLSSVKESIKDTDIKLGAQNMHWEESGAYTGEVSALMLKEVGVDYCILGHSERREYFNESDETVNKKLKAAFENGLKPIVCVGETLQQREEGNAEYIITNQTELALQGLTNEQVENTIIAYEPIWAIGTGKTATSEDANNSIKSIRNKITQIYGKEVAEQVIIQYGGSVKPSNAKELFETSDIDGALVGGASLKVEDFEKIVQWGQQ